MRDQHPWIRDYFHGPRGRAALAADAALVDRTHTHEGAAGGGAS